MCSSVAEGTVSFIVPTIGRASLAATLNSIHCVAGDEVIVIGGRVAPVTTHLPVRWIPCQPGGHFGCEERTLGISQARGDYLAFIDDDDTYLPFARHLMTAAMECAWRRPALFRMRYPNGAELWRKPVLEVGNVSTQMMLIPNDRAKLGTWTTRREGDFDFLTSMRWPSAAIAWCPSVIAQMGHNEAYVTA
jgi:hypothetical protein